jgi:hypothetical protein
MAKRGVPARLDRRATVTQAAPRTDSRTWAEVGFASGILAVVAYGLASAVPMPSALEAVAASVFGVGIGLASAGLYEVLGCIGRGFPSRSPSARTSQPRSRSR